MKVRYQRQATTWTGHKICIFGKKSFALYPGSLPIQKRKKEKKHNHSTILTGHKHGIILIQNGFGKNKNRKRHKNDEHGLLSQELHRTFFWSNSFNQSPVKPTGCFLATQKDWQILCVSKSCPTTPAPQHSLCPSHNPPTPQSLQFTHVVIRWLIAGNVQRYVDSENSHDKGGGAYWWLICI